MFFLDLFQMNHYSKTALEKNEQLWEWKKLWRGAWVDEYFRQLGYQLITYIISAINHCTDETFSVNSLLFKAFLKT